MRIESVARALGASMRQTKAKARARARGRLPSDVRPHRHTHAPGNGESDLPFWPVLRLGTLDDFKYRLDTRHKGYYSQLPGNVGKKTRVHESADRHAIRHGRRETHSGQQWSPPFSLGVRASLPLVSVRYHYAAPNGLHDDASRLV